MTRTYNINIKKDRPKTWTKKRISIIIIVSITYGIWFNFLDSAAFCNPSENRLNCTPIGQALGTNYIYQPWNIIGHCVPGLFMLLFSPRRIELFIAGILISSAVMDSPLWGVMKLNFHNLPLWHMEGNNLYAVTWHLSDWIVYYYNPIGSYQVWKEHWLHVGLPTAAMIFWSVVGRIVAAAALIWLQDKQESVKGEFSLRNLLRRRNVS